MTTRGNVGACHSERSEESPYFFGSGEHTDAKKVALIISHNPTWSDLSADWFGKK